MVLNCPTALVEATGSTPQREAVKLEQVCQWKTRQQGRGQQANNTLAKHRHLLANQWGAVHCQVDRRFHIGQKDGIFMEMSSGRTISSLVDARKWLWCG